MTDAEEIASLEAQLLTEEENYKEMEEVAKKVTEQGKREVSDRAEEEKRKAVDNALLGMSKKREKGVHRSVDIRLQDVVACFHTNNLVLINVLFIC